MAMWLCGYVAIKISNLQIFKFRNLKSSKLWEHRTSIFFEILESQISIDNIFPGCSHISLYFLNKLVVIGRATGPDFDKILEVPEIIQKVVESIRNR